MKLQLTSRILMLIQAIGTGLVIGATLLLLQLDEIVNGLLYEYGLQFHYEWAVPYWTFLRVVLVILGCIAGVNVFAAVLTILGRQTPQPVKTQLAKTQLARNVPIPSKPTTKAMRGTRKETANEKGENGVKIAALPMVCNKCGKVFTQPLCMFDFKSGRPRLVNVCPYCNAILAVTGNSKDM